MPVCHGRRRSDKDDPSAKKSGKPSAYDFDDSAEEEDDKGGDDQEDMETDTADGKEGRREEAVTDAVDISPER